LFLLCLGCRCLTVPEESWVRHTLMVHLWNVLHTTSHHTSVMCCV
jgi:hypothetical protein